VAGWLVVAGSAVVVLMVLDQVAKLHSLDTREAVEKYLARPPGDQLGLGVQDAITALRVVLTVTGVAAAASAVLGWYALHRSRGARVALSVLAVPLFVSGFTFGGFVGGGVLPAMVSAAVLMLWLQPARDWFAGVVRAAPVAPPRPTPPPPGPSGRDPLLDLPPPTAPPLHPTPYAAAPVAPPVAPPAAAGERPGALVWACVVTWVSTTTAVTLLAAWLIGFLVEPHAYLDDLRRQNPDLALSDADLRTLVLVFCAVFIVWSVVAAALALLVWRRVRWASVALVASAGLACLTLVPIIACVAAGVLLLRPDTRAWLRG
jgi:hypothetical protein